MIEVLIVCFANTCRSPVAEALLAARVDPFDVTVRSRGLAGGPGDVPEALATVLASRGVTLGPAGAPLARQEARDADLVLFVERRLLREAVVADPTIWPKSFTLREFARRALIDPPERSEEQFAQWLSVLHAKRRREELLGSDERDDVSDPGLGGESADYEAMVDALTIDVDRVVPFLTGWSSAA